MPSLNLLKTLFEIICVELNKLLYGEKVSDKKYAKNLLFKI